MRLGCAERSGFHSLLCCDSPCYPSLSPLSCPPESAGHCAGPWYGEALGGSKTQDLTHNGAQTTEGQARGRVGTAGPHVLGEDAARPGLAEGVL